MRPSPETDAEERKQMEAFGAVDANFCAFARRLEGQRDELMEALEYTLEHILELRDAWSRGCISEHDGKGGMRSNRNVEVEQRARAAIRKVRGEGKA